MALARFLQVSDLHLGRPFAWLPQDRREDRRRDQQRALERAVSLAVEHGVAAILVPGDLFDSAMPDAALLTFAIKTFETPGCPPVFVAPGNHDPASASNAAWSARLLRARGMAWPAHVHVFDTPEWSAMPVPGLPGVRVWGRCFTANIESAERPLAAGALAPVANGDPRGFEIALFHGSREGRCPPAQKMTAPFSDAEALASPFTYLAVGHYHAPSSIAAAEGGGVRLAYAGSAVALDHGEMGLHGALEIAVRWGDRKPVAEIDTLELDRRRVHEVGIDVTGASGADALDRRILKALDVAGAGEQDLATVRLTGRLGAGVRWTGPGPELRARLFHMRADTTALRPDHDLEPYRTGEGRTTEERFGAGMLARIEAATDPAERALLERALHYGLDAFKLREVVPVLDEEAR